MGFGGEPERQRQLGRHRRYGRIILKLTFKKRDGAAAAWTGFFWLRIGRGGGLL
jgi:hypothetical protein